MTEERIPIAGPWITQKEIDYVSDAVRTAWYANAGKYNAKFEEAFAAYLGREYAVSLPSCTSGLHLALAAGGVGPGDEVIVPESTWIATSAPISYLGATEVFADIDPVNWCLSAESLAQCITERSKVVVLVDLYGGLPDMDAVLAVAEEHGLLVVEDAAQSIGAHYKGMKAGAFGDVSVFSFHGTKTLTTGEGGMLVTDRRDLLEKVWFLRDHGRDPGGKMFWNLEVGFKYRMSSLQAALGLAQLERIDELIAKKREIFSWYQEELDQVSELTLNHEPADTKNTYWMVTIIVAKETGLDKETLLARLSEKGIDCRPFFYPLSMLPAYADRPQAQAAQKRNRIAYDLSDRAINLPSALGLTREQVSRVCQAVKEIIRSA